MLLIDVRKSPAHKDAAIAYFQEKWASETSRMVYEDCISRSIAAENPLPVWYLLEDAGRIVGCAGLITNDFISCGDLWPWLCALYVETDRRGEGLAGLLIDGAKRDAAAMGYPNLYLSTGMTGFYERYGFDYLCVGYHPWGECSRVYACRLDRTNTPPAHEREDD